MDDSILIVENGTPRWGKNNSNSYVTVEEADTFHKSRGNRLWNDVPTVDRGQWSVPQSYSTFQLLNFDVEFVPLRVF